MIISSEQSVNCRIYRTGLTVKEKKDARDLMQGFDHFIISSREQDLTVEKNSVIPLTAISI